MPPNVKGLPTLYPMGAVRAVAFLPIFQYYFVGLFILGPVVICIGTLILQARMEPVLYQTKEGMRDMR